MAQFLNFEAFRSISSVMMNSNSNIINNLSNIVNKYGEPQTNNFSFDVNSPNIVVYYVQNASINHHEQFEDDAGAATTYDNEICVNVVDDDTSHVFMLPNSELAGEITLERLKVLLPIKGPFLFRFKIKTPNKYNKDFVWIDMNGDTEKVPLYKRQIHVKLLMMPIIRRSMPKYMLRNSSYLFVPPEEQLKPYLDKIMRKLPNSYSFIQDDTISNENSRVGQRFEDQERTSIRTNICGMELKPNTSIPHKHGMSKHKERSASAHSQLQGHIAELAKSREKFRNKNEHMTQAESNVEDNFNWKADWENFRRSNDKPDGTSDDVKIIPQSSIQSSIVFDHMNATGSFKSSSNNLNDLLSFDGPNNGFSGSNTVLNIPPESFNYESDNRTESSDTDMLKKEKRAEDKHERVRQRVQESLSLHEGRKRIEQEKLQAKLNASDDPDLRREFLRWAKTSEGTYKDLRTLLSSLQEILWNDADWTPKTISDLMMSSQRVKKAYRAAILMCHPDRHQQASPQQQYRAECIFQALNEAHEVWKANQTTI